MLNTVLGVETSCDDTGVAIYDFQHAKRMRQGCRVARVHSQTTTHEKYGGVVPELASRDHIIHLQRLIVACLKESSLTLKDIDGFAYTQGPGLAGALLTGSNYTRSLSWGLNKPCVGVHHMEGHLLSPMLEYDDIEPPFLGLLISGGHTLLVEVEQLGKYRILGRSIDDAVGEAFDKSAKLLGLGYPGGLALSNLAESGDANHYSFSRPMTAQAGKKLSLQAKLNFSFSGLKTEVRNLYMETHKSTKNEEELRTIRKNIAASFEQAVADTLSIKVKTAIDFLKGKSNPKQLVVAGGVAANQKIRMSLQRLCDQTNVKMFVPSPRLCTDNGEMIAFVGWLRLNGLRNDSVKSDQIDESGIDDSRIFPRWELDTLVPIDS